MSPSTPYTDPSRRYTTYSYQFNSSSDRSALPAASYSSLSPPSSAAERRTKTSRERREEREEEATR